MMQLTSDLKALLDQMISLSGAEDLPIATYDHQIFAFTGSHNVNDYIRVNVAKPLELQSMLDHLVKQKALEPMDAEGLYKITFVGRHRREFFFLELRDFLLKSILTPIVVALATSWIYNWLH